MAILKISGYISKYDPIAKRHDAARKHLHYIVTRKSENGQEMRRQLFSREGDVDYEYALNLIETQRAHIFKIILNFDPIKEDTKRDLNLELITRLVIIKLQERLGKDIEFVAVLHDNHGNLHNSKHLRHIHSMVFTNSRIEKSDIKALRWQATKRALSQRRDRDRDLVQRVFQNSRSTEYQRPIGMAGGRARQSARTPRRFCSCGQTISRKRIMEGENKCFKCGLKQERNMELSL